MSIEANEIIDIIIERLEHQTKMAANYHIERDKAQQEVYDLKKEVKSLQDKLYFKDVDIRNCKKVIEDLQNGIINE